ncbi:EF-hand calcium-binding domain-containing protein 12 isoform X2 [Xenopus laevis]|uniref:EF-hand calcium-binding domain-containing protein 12 isoform X2 n=1 Tax=Xenopus laevis TaxID=8355 RepID=A0A8J0V7U0_XENLA|nr:EF-hand calcium-binding domain-containing protein 12 isoform X2 [Xenopus laevis]
MAKEVSFLDSPLTTDDKISKHYQRDLQKTLLFKMACRTFGPPTSRRRQIIAPPMEQLVPGTSDPDGALSNVSSISTKAMSDTVTSQEGEAVQSCADWIAERKKFRAQLDCMGDLKKWFQGKPFLTELECRVEERITDKRSQSHVCFTTLPDTIISGMSQNTDHSIRKSPQSGMARPSIKQPNPDALAILDQYLRKHHLRLVDLYNQTDKGKMKKISSSDLKAVRKEAAIPVSDIQFDNLVISLSNKDPNYINYKELSKGRHQWKLQNRKGSRGWMTAKSASLAGQRANIRRLSECQSVLRMPQKEQNVVQHAAETPVSKSGIWNPQAASISGKSEQSEGSQFLQVPSVSLDERRPMTYEDMEEIGKGYRETKRRAKSNTRLLEWLEQCRLVRSGNAAVDSHSVPSTLEDEVSETVNRYRRQCLEQYHQILELCQNHGVSLSECLLEKALLYPGDKLICDSGQQLRQLRQPGTTPANSKYFKKRQTSVKENHRLGREAWIIPLKGSPRDTQTSISVSGFHKNIPSSTPYPPEQYVNRVRAKVRGSKEAGMETMNCWITFEQFQDMIGNVVKRYPHCFLTSEENAFWPGQLLDKLRVYLPKVSPSGLKQPVAATVT